MSFLFLEYDRWPAVGDGSGTAIRAPTLYPPLYELSEDCASSLCAAVAGQQADPDTDTDTNTDTDTDTIYRLLTLN